MVKIAFNMPNVYLDVCCETCVWGVRGCAMWQPRQGHINAIFNGQCHMSTIFIRTLVDVADDVVPPKPVVATVASDVAMAGTYVDDVLAMTWPAMSSHIFGGFGFKSVFTLMSPETHGCFRKHWPMFTGCLLRCLCWHLVCGLWCELSTTTCQ